MDANGCRCRNRRRVLRSHDTEKVIHFLHAGGIPMKFHIGGIYTSLGDAAHVFVLTAATARIAGHGLGGRPCAGLCGRAGRRTLLGGERGSIDFTW